MGWREDADAILARIEESGAKSAASMAQMEEATQNLQVIEFRLALERDLAELSKPDAKILPFRPRSHG